MTRLCAALSAAALASPLSHSARPNGTFVQANRPVALGRLMDTRDPAVRMHDGALPRAAKKGWPLLTLLAILLAACLPSAMQAQSGPVWFWFATCGGPAMNLEVRLDGRMLYKSTFPLCRASRKSPESQGESSRVQFYFCPGRTIKWLGYRDAPEKTGADQLIETDLWQAGADPDDLLIGVSFISGSRIYMNTVVVARPGHRDSTTVADGLVVTTYPSRKPTSRGR